MTILGVAVRLGRVQADAGRLQHVAYLLGGGLIGFVALAFPPSWPILAFITAVLLGSALRRARVGSIGMLLTGFGVPWVLLLGAGMIADLTDTAVTGSPQAVYWLAFGAVVLGTGLGLLIAAAIRSPRG